jgi:hypothetical protein
MLLGGIKSMVIDNDKSQSVQWPNLWNWTADAPRGGGMKMIDEILLQGLLAFCILNDYEPATGKSSTALQMAMERCLSKSDTELDLIARDEPSLSTLLWALTCVVTALDAEVEASGSTGTYRNLLLNKLFRLFKAPRELQWRKIRPTLHRFWMPPHVEERMQSCWTKGLRCWRERR